MHKKTRELWYAIAILKLYLAWWQVSHQIVENLWCSVCLSAELDVFFTCVTNRNDSHFESDFYSPFRPADRPLTYEQPWFSPYIQGWWLSIFRLRIHYKRSSTVEHVRFIGPDEFDGKFAKWPFGENLGRRNLKFNQHFQKTMVTLTMDESKFEIDLQEWF